MLINIASNRKKVKSEKKKLKKLENRSKLEHGKEKTQVGDFGKMEVAKSDEKKSENKNLSIGKRKLELKGVNKNLSKQILFEKT